MQQSIIAAQTVLHLDDIPTGTATIMFIQTLGGALFIAIGQNIFTNRLISNLVTDVPSLNPGIVLNVGATSLRNAVDDSLLPAVLKAYNSALVQTYYVSVAIAALSIFGSIGVEWKSVKGKKIESVAA